MKRMDRRALFASGAAAALLAATGVQAQVLPRSGGRLRAALSGASRDDGWDLAPGGLFMLAAQHTVFEALTEVAADGSLSGVSICGRVSGFTMAHRCARRMLWPVWPIRWTARCGPKVRGALLCT